MNRILVFIAGIAAAVGLVALTGSLCGVNSSGATTLEQGVPAPSSQPPSVPVVAANAPHVPFISAVAPPAGAELAPDFSWTGANGAQQSLGDYRGRVVMINFWATWCPPCRRELPDIVKVRQEMASQGFEVIGVTVGEEPRPGLTVAQHVGEFATKNGLSYPLLIANDDVIGAYGGIQSIPTTVFVDREGKVAKVVNGMMTGEEMRRILSSVL